MYDYDPGDNITGIRVPWVDNITDEDFLVWMRVAAFPHFRKLYRIIDKDALNNKSATELSGTIHILINNTFNVTEFGNKSLVLTELSWLGGKNTFIGWLYLVVGALYLIFAIVFTGKQLIHPRKFADTRLLPWTSSGSTEEQIVNEDDGFADGQVVEVTDPVSD